MYSLASIRARYVSSSFSLLLFICIHALLFISFASIFKSFFSHSRRGCMYEEFDSERKIDHTNSNNYNCPPFLFALHFSPLFSIIDHYLT